MNQMSETTYFDYLFAGAGASATLLLMSMERQGLLKNKSIAIIDPDNKVKSDKTFCFWAYPEDSISNHCNNLISHRWNNIVVNQNSNDSITPLQYYHIPGISVSDELHRIIRQYNITHIQKSVDTIAGNSSGALVHAESSSYHAALVFDSRTPTFLPTQANESHLAQSFVGYVIRTKEELKDFKSVKLMDFAVNQQNHTQFMYVLPFDKNSALVELTRFGSEILTQTEAEEVLNEYIKLHYGSSEIVDVEKGCIPMSNAKIMQENIPNVLPIGSRAGAVKASTGYAFKNMYQHAEDISKSLKNKSLPKEKHATNRFKFYDRLLLLILRDSAEMGKPIFQTLFRKNKAIDVLHFIEEKSSFASDLKILTSLPLKPFLQALFFDLKVRFKHLQHPFFLVLLTLLLLAIQAFAPTMFNPIQVILLSLGLILVGIPHGALDNVVESGDIHKKIDFTFIGKYLLKAGIFFLVWVLSPNIALLLFILYSAMHFGQADMREWKNNASAFIQSFLWGTMVLGIILLGHVAEVNTILLNMETTVIPLNDSQGMQVAMTLAGIATIWGLIQGNLPMLLSTAFLFLASYLPLLSAFGIYFIGQHSITGWGHLKTTLKASNMQMFKKALPYNIGAWLLFGLLILNYNSFWISSFFIFISCISLPHVMAMNTFYVKHHS
jgi:lycopene beta-cyclase